MAKGLNDCNCGAHIGIHLTAERFVTSFTLNKGSRTWNKQAKSRA